MSLKVSLAQMGILLGKPDENLVKARNMTALAIACNCVGVSKDTHFFGHSCIIDPWGQTIVEAGEDEELLTAEIGIDKVDQARSEIPVLADRRPEIYEEES